MLYSLRLTLHRAIFTHQARGHSATRCRDTAARSLSANSTTYTSTCEVTDQGTCTTTRPLYSVKTWNSLSKAGPSQVLAAAALSADRLSRRAARQLLGWEG
ncbi:hypothetical protein E2C01_092730 [Portunus trituberculatus]|uniref:Uncharacterized protein n=1 Tax=Portunus trituberculatus TaxID=210409 RepID=A0A5B7JS73_PORTR|nr:hypothetical protein [Portunus trituberculatus]